MKKNLMKTALALAPAAMVMFFTGCTNEELVSEQVTQYEKNFTETFGEIDPTHDWSMATPVTANIDLSNVPEGTYEVKIYSEKMAIYSRKPLWMVRLNCISMPSRARTLSAYMHARPLLSD